VARDRLTAFTDGVIAVIITIMVLELRPPRGVGWADLAAVYPGLLVYALSFAYVAIYWNNHHHFFHLVDKVDGAVLWANLDLLFWLSLVPFTTAWLGQAPSAKVPTAVYGLSLLLAALAWYVMQSVIIFRQGPNSPLKKAIGGDVKGRLSLLLYVAGVALAFVSPLAADLLYLAVALMWLAPDSRVEGAVRSSEERLPPDRAKR
jgi:uncharacterized membrane protein